MSEESDNPGVPGTVFLRVQGLACQRGERLVFTGLDFSAGAGDIVWVRGGNGSGKTTLLRTLAGLAAPAAGRIELGGPGRAVYVGHANALNGDLAAAEALRFLLRLDGLEPRPDAIDGALARFGLAHRRWVPVRALSQGQRRRVALARLCLQPGPLAWLLDEPFDALDDEGAATLMTLLVEHAQRGGLVVLSSHVALPKAAIRPLEVQLDLAMPAQAGPPAPAFAR